MNEKLNELKKIIKNSEYIVFFGGAGVSTESGIPDFRSSTGIYHEDYKFSPEEVVSHSFYVKHPKEFYEFYKAKLCYPNAKPNECHKTLVKLEKQGKLKAIITQNIDGLHQKAGSINVIELHGSTLRNYCEDCNAFYDLDYVLKQKDVPICSKCGGTIKPDVVLYEEGLNMDLFDWAANYIRNADTLIIGGTSLVVYPAAYLVNYFRGKHLVVINKTPSNIQNENLLEINAPIGEVFSKLDI